MRVEILQGPGLSNPIVLTDVARVLILGDLGTPVSVASEWMPGEITLGTVDEGARFQQLLVGLGIDRTVLATPLVLKPS